MARLALPCLLLLVALAGCVKMELPESEELKEIFTSEEHTMFEEPVPVNVPQLDASQLGGWRLLCDECHVGPNYSSHKILKWGHLEQCESQSTCLNCHGAHLHRLDVRGSKSVCIECHMQRELTLACDACHIAGWRQLHTPAGHSRATHGEWALEQLDNCKSCHGSNAWCSACHGGIEMPHPDDFLGQHPTIVRGDPQQCSTCHGATPCETCHEERGINFDTPGGIQ